MTNLKHIRSQSTYIKIEIIEPFLFHTFSVKYSHHITFIFTVTRIDCYKNVRGNDKMLIHTQLSDYKYKYGVTYSYINVVFFNRKKCQNFYVH